MDRLDILSSSTNPLIQDVRRAIHSGSLTADGYCVAESFHLLAEAARSPARIVRVLARESVLDRVRQMTRARVTGVTEKLFDALSGTETSQGVIALVEPRAAVFADIFAGRGPVVVLDGIQDPGNAGNIARAVEAFGGAGLLFVKGAVHPYHPKTLRASAGSLFRLPLAFGILAEQVISLATQFERRCYAAMPGAALAADEAALAHSLLIIGSEGHGVSGALLAHAERLTIPTTGVESLNAAVSAAILLYEAQRQLKVQRPFSA